MSTSSELRKASGYAPGPTPTDPKDIPTYLKRELLRLSQIITKLQAEILALKANATQTGA